FFVRRERNSSHFAGAVALDTSAKKDGRDIAAERDAGSGGSGGKGSADAQTDGKRTKLHATSKGIPGAYGYDTLTARNRSHHQQRLDSLRHLVRQGRVDAL